MQIQAHEVHKRYHDGEGRSLHILKGLHFETKTASTVAITGASGTGKSTFLHLLGGLEAMDEGEIIIEGQVLSKMDRETCARFRNHQIGFIFQFHHLLQDFTAVENVMMPLLIDGIAPAKAKKIAGDWLIEMGMGERLHHKSSQLSGGEQQRVAIARAIAHSPKIILADEPTGNLDQETGQRVLELLLKLNQNHGITLLMITHNLLLAKAMSVQYQMENGLLHPIASSSPLGAISSP